MKKWRLLNKKKRYWYCISYRMDKAVDNISVSHFDGSCVFSDFKPLSDVDYDKLKDLVFGNCFSSGYDNYSLSITGISRL